MIFVNKFATKLDTFCQGNMNSRVSFSQQSLNFILCDDFCLHILQIQFATKLNNFVITVIISITLKSVLAGHVAESSYVVRGDNTGHFVGDNRGHISSGVVGGVTSETFSFDGVVGGAPAAKRQRRTPSPDRRRTSSSGVRSGEKGKRENSRERKEGRRDSREKQYVDSREKQYGDSWEKQYGDNRESAERRNKLSRRRF